MAGISAASVLKLLMNMGIASLAGGGSGGIGGGWGGYAPGGFSGDGTSPGPLANEYPKEFAPGINHLYNVAYIPGNPQENASGRPARDTIERAAVQQTIREHNDALFKYLRMLPKDATPRQVRDAMQRGREDEKKLPAWWNESDNRRQFQVSSSAVSGIRVTPDGAVEVAWGSSPDTWYTFRQYENTQKASEAARELLKSESIGRAVYPVISRGMGGPTVSKKSGKMLGEWNAPNYNAGMAK